MFLQLPGMNSPEMQGHGELLETAVMLYRAGDKDKDKGKVRHIFLFETALIVRCASSHPRLFLCWGVEVGC